MSDIVKLLYPIYLDVPMIVSFVAATEGGYALENAIKQTQATTEDTKGEVAGEIGLSGLLSNLVKVDAKSSANLEDQQVRSYESQLVLKHTEASLFMGLRNKLYSQHRIVSLDTCEQSEWDALQLSPFSDLVELSGHIYRSPINEIARLGERFLSFMSGNKENTASSTNVSSGDQQAQAIAVIQGIRNDLDTSPLSDVLLLHEGKWRKSAVLDLSTKILPLIEQDRLICGRVVVLGKVTRILKQQETINLCRRSLLGYTAQKVLSDMMLSFENIPGINIKLAPYEVKCPAVEIIPMAIYA